MNQYYIHILASYSRCLYVGVTSDLIKRMWEHRYTPTGFVLRYKTTRLVYFEASPNPMNAITREKQIKGWLRSKKIALIETANPFWEDVAAGWFDAPRSE